MEEPFRRAGEENLEAMRKARAAVERGKAPEAEERQCQHDGDDDEELDEVAGQRRLQPSEWLGDCLGAALLDRLMNGGTAPERQMLVAPQGITLRRSTDTVAVNHPVLRSAMSFIKSNLSEPIGAPQIADGIGISRLQLDRLFAKELGISVGREIARQRLVQAKLLLRNTDAPLTEIAANTGFCNAAYLANVFKSETGLTPGAWRKGD